MDKTELYQLKYNRKFTFRRRRNGWSTCTVRLCLPFLVYSPFTFSNSTQQTVDADLLGKIVVAIATVLVAQAVIPLVKSWFRSSKLKKTYRSYLRAHVTNTLDSYQDVCNVSFVEKNFVKNKPDWLECLKEAGVGVPRIFLNIENVIKKTGETPDYIPSVSYLGLDDHTLDHTSPIWEVNGRESEAALQYFITQQQVQSSIDYQYSDWFFDLIKSGCSDKRNRWCLALSNVMFDMAQHYVSAVKLKAELDKVK